MKSRKKILILLALVSAIFFSVLYFAIRLLFLIIAKHCWYEKVIGAILLLSEVYILIHGIGYIIDITRVLLNESSQDIKKMRLKSHPPVAALIPSFHEPLDILENTISSCYNMTYRNKYIFLLDDTKYEEMTEELRTYKKEIENLCKKWNIGLFRRKWRGAKAGIINDFLELMKGNRKKEFRLKEFGKNANLSKIKYTAIFDSDQNPFFDFLEDLVIQMERDPTLAFIQTPQYYTNYEQNRVASSAGLQQAVFYEFICEGKSISGSMYCCGTNVLFRVKALYDVGGFDETSITEDFATSLKLHLKKWSTKYYSHVGAFGMGPEDLGGYFKQQYRWSAGTIGVLKKVVLELLKNPKKMSAVKWWEYLLSGSYYLIGIILLLFMIFPLTFLFFNIPSYFIDFKIYLTIFLPYFSLGIFIFLGMLATRGYRAKDLFLGQLLVLQTFPIYIKASIDAFLGRKKKFEITSKGKSLSLPLSALWPQISMALLIFIGIVWGINRIIFERDFVIAIGANIFWCIYNFIALSFIFYFNSPQKFKKET